MGFVPEISAQVAPEMGGSASFRGDGRLWPFAVVARDTLAGGDGRDASWAAHDPSRPPPVTAVDLPKDKAVFWAPQKRHFPPWKPL